MGGNTTPQRQSTISAFFKPVSSPNKNASAESSNKENNGQTSPKASNSSSGNGGKRTMPSTRTKRTLGSSASPQKKQTGHGSRSPHKRAPSSLSDADDSDDEYKPAREDNDDQHDETPLLPEEVEEEENEDSPLSRRPRAPASTSRSSFLTAPKTTTSSSSSLASKFSFKKHTPSNNISYSKDAAISPKETVLEDSEQRPDMVDVGDSQTPGDSASVEMDEEKAARRARFLDKLGNFRSSAAIPPKEHEKTNQEEDGDDREEEDGDSSFVMSSNSRNKRRRLIVSESEGDDGDSDLDYVDGDNEARNKASKSNANEVGSTKKMKPSTATTATSKSSSSTSTTDTNTGQDAWKSMFFSSGSSKGKKDKPPFTPLEKQFIEIKQQYPDAILCIEVGYKFKFFGEDAQIASKELSIAHFMDHNFYTASIPVHRLDVHVRRLVHAGYKVGVVRQTETAALKSVGDNKSAPFTRKLTNLYTKATFLESLEQDVAGLSADASSPSSHYLACIVEELQGGMGADERVKCSILAVQPATGDIVYDEFQDTYMRSELETRLLHIQPAELILPEKGLSPATEKLVRHLSMPSHGSVGSGRHSEVRTERSQAFHKYNKAFSLVSEFYSNILKEGQQRQEQQQQHRQKEQESGSSSKATAATIEDRLAGLMTTVIGLPQNVIVALWAMIDHLKAFGLEHVFVQTKYFQPFHTLSHMLLNGNTLNNLEIFRNQTDWSVKGSLLEILDQTKTGFGRRLLKKWVGKPLVDRRMLQQRVDAVEEILAKQRGTGGGDGQPNEALAKVEKCLTGLMDLEKGICRIHYGYATPKEFWLVLKTFNKILQLFPERVGSRGKSRKMRAIAGSDDEHDASIGSEDFGLESPYLNELIASLTVASDSVLYFLNALDEQAAKQNDKVRLLDRELAATKWPEILQHEADIEETEEQLRQHLKEVQKLLREPRLDFTSVAGIDYLIEVKNKDTPKVPKSWVKISGTKQVSRFHTPETTKLIHAKAQHQERLTLRCTEAFKELCKEFSSQYEVFRDVVQALATLDCLFSLAAVARRPGYCKAEYVDSEDEYEDGEKSEAGMASNVGGRRGQRGRGASTVIEIKQGRHPMVEQMLQGSAGTDFVPNDVDFGKRTTPLVTCSASTENDREAVAAALERDKWTSDEQKTMILTGPNMGGKSCYIRQVALLCLMAQIGSYVPAERARLSLLDAIYTRMGASDNLFGNESTFMVELQETSDILRMATPKSLIILDELGRGTSTLDGVAIAYAVLKYCVTEIRATTLFVTHYPSLAEVANEFPKGRVRNYHMGFMATKNIVETSPSTSSGTEAQGSTTPTKAWIDSAEDHQEVSEHDEIVFLYNLVEGVSLKSYGLNVARLAKLPLSVIARAKDKSKELEILLEQRRQKRRLNTNDTSKGKKRPHADVSVDDDYDGQSSSLSARQLQSIEMLRRIWDCKTPEQAKKVFDLCR
ncbi:Mismatch repair protein msh3 [Actinomortierella wolfii]|nr:Mismatch repair protein msh3 [Actinomortierella wolfii]